MRRLTFYIAATLLTFTVGVVAASLWFSRHRNAQESAGQSRPIARQESEVKATDSERVSNAVAEPRWFYMTEPIKWDRDGWTHEARIVIFYANGEWGRVTPSIRREEKRLDVGFAEGFTAEMGKWKEEGGIIIVTIEKRKIYLGLPMPGQARPPIVERWRIRGGALGQSGKILISPKGNYRLLKNDELLEPEKVASVPYGVRDGNDPIGEEF